MRQPKGEYGYINGQRKTYLMGTIIGLVAIVTLYCIDQFVFTEGNVLLIITVLLALPVAQFLVKLILYSQYKEGNETFYRQLEAISDQLVYLASLAIVRGKKTLFYQFLVVTDNEIVLLVDKKLERKAVLEYKEQIEKLIKPKGYIATVNIFNDEQAMYAYVKKELKSKLNNIDTTNQVDMANVLLDNAI